MAKKKSLEELTLMDRFLFNEVMENPENLQTLLEIILGKPIYLPSLPQSEREIRTSPLKRYIKVDVWSEDDDGNIYDAEVQKENTKNLPKRSRYYQGVIDSKLLKPGELDFNRIPDVYIIIIAPFDLFGYGKYMYSFQMMDKDNPDNVLDDGATRLFLNTHGTNDNEVSPELVELLHYMEHTNEDAEKPSTNDSLQKLKDRVKSVQHDAEVSVRFMQAWEEKLYYEMKAREEGEDLINRLYALLLEQHREEDMKRCLVDKDFRKKLMDELGIQ